MKQETAKVTKAITLADIHALLPTLDGAGYDALRGSILRRGLLTPILAIQGKNGEPDVVVDGRARFKICTELGIEVTAIYLDEAANDAECSVSNNLDRRHLSLGQLAMLAEAMANTQRGGNQHTAKAACSRKEAARLLGVSEDSIDRARRIKNGGCKKLVDMVTTGKTALDAAAKLVKAFPDHGDQEEVITKGMARVQKEQYKKQVLDAKRATAQELAKNNGAALKTLTGTYSVIYADPPWDYGGNNKGSFCDPSVYYPLMSTAAIQALPVKDCVGKDAALYLWVPSSLLKDGLAVLEAWGFSYVSSMVWCKNRAVMSPGPTKTAHEMLLIGRRGSSLHDTKQRLNSWVVAKATAHSKKPGVFADMIDRMYPGYPKLEMFARAPRSGEWSVYGNEVVKKGAVKKSAKKLAAKKPAVKKPVANPKVVKPVNQLEANRALVRKQFFAANDPRSTIAA